MRNPCSTNRCSTNRCDDGDVDGGGVDGGDVLGGRRRHRQGRVVVTASVDAEVVLGARRSKSVRGTYKCSMPYHI